MLRAVESLEPELTRLCQSKSWSLVEERAVSHPHEATPSDVAKAGGGTTVLALAIRHGAPIMVIESLSEARRAQLGIVHKIRGSVLHEAIRHHAPLKTVGYLVEILVQQEGKYFLGTQDDMERTPLHHMMLKVVNSMDCPGSLWQMIRNLVLLFPPAIQAFDSDGNTPLMLLLLHHDPYRNRGAHDDHVYRIVQLLVTLCPQAASHSRRVSLQCAHQQPNEEGPTPLTFALLYGRCEKIIFTLIEASYRAGINACLKKITGYQETALHVAVSLRYSHEMLKRLVQMEPASLHCSDKHGLTPLDWLWIRHVLDSRDTHRIQVLASTRRFLPNSFVEWHKRALECPNNFDQRQIEQFWQTMKFMVNATREVAGNRTFEVQPTFLHSVCTSHCPLAIVRLALQKNRSDVTIKDALGRLPLHNAAGRSGYKIKVPIGFSQVDEVIEEESPVHILLNEFPEGARISDSQRQLPLHCAIEANLNSEVIDDLLRRNPDALERRDGKTFLYPFLQANGVQTAYALLKRDPTFIALATTS